MKSPDVKTILTLIAFWVGISACAQQTGRDTERILLATDNATVTVDTVNQTTKTLTTPFVAVTYNGGPLAIYLYDEQHSSQDGDWSLINTDSAVSSLDPDIIANSFGTYGSVTDTLAGKDYTFTVRANSVTGGPNGALQVIFDEFDYYRSKIIVTYVENGQSYASYFYSPNSATAHVFGWEQPIPFYESYGFDDLNNPVEFHDAMVNLGDLFDSDSDSMDIKVDQRNVNHLNWAEEEAFYRELVENLGTTTEPYPIGVGVDMVDFGDKKSSPVVPPSRQLERWASGSDMVFDPPLGTDQVIDTSSLFCHTYTVTMDDPGTMPVLDFEGLSPNLTVDTVYTTKIDSLKYRVDVVFRAGSAVSTEDFSVDFTAVTVGEDEHSIDDLIIKYGPNPFSSRINMSYDLLDNYDLQLSVYNTSGQLIENVDLGRQAPGRHDFSWGPPKGSLPDGMYIFRIEGFNTTGGHFSKAVKIRKY